MSKLKNVLNIIAGLAIIAGLGWVVVQSVIYLIGAVGGLDKSLQTATITAIPVIAVALISLYANKSLETKRAVEQAMRPRKLDLYEDFDRFFMSIFTPEDVQKSPTEKEITSYFVNKNPELLSFASNTVIKKWGKLRANLSSDKLSNVDKMLLVEDLLKEIRIDLGHGKRGFKKGDIELLGDDFRHEALIYTSDLDDSTRWSAASKKYIEDNFPHVYIAGLAKTHLSALSELYSWIFSNFEDLHSQEHTESLKVKERILTL